jgi:hypothetical protein
MNINQVYRARTLAHDPTVPFPARDALLKLLTEREQLLGYISQIELVAKQASQDGNRWKMT